MNSMPEAGRSNVISVKGLIKDYNSFRAVNDIEFEIEKGECFGFLGPNGAGKTSVMRILYCFMPPTQGTVRVFGIDVLDDPSLVKSRIGVMPQDDNLDVDLTVLENLVVYARYFRIPRKKSIPLVLKLLDYVDLTEKKSAPILSLSGGMKRSLLLARALVNHPEVLVLDEPTTGLDPHNRHTVWDKLDDLKSNKTTLVLTTHYMEEADRLCDRVAIMDSGRIVTIDSPTNLKTIHGGSLEEVYLKLTGRPLEP